MEMRRSEKARRWRTSLMEAFHFPKPPPPLQPSLFSLFFHTLYLCPSPPARPATTPVESHVLIWSRGPPTLLTFAFFFLFISISSRLVGYSSFPAPWPPLFIGWAPVPPLCTLAPCGACFCLSPAETTPVCENVNYNKHLFNDMQPLPVFPVASSPSVQCSSVEPEFSDWRRGPFMYQSCVFEAHTNKRCTSTPPYPPLPVSIFSLHFGLFLVGSRRWIKHCK